MNANGVERRRYPRAEIDFRGVLETENNDTVNLRARNISATGIYLDADARLELFTEVSLLIALPSAGNGRAVMFRCQGVIVRVEETGPGNLFGVAVHFTFIEEEYRRAIMEYVETARK